MGNIVLAKKTCIYLGISFIRTSGIGSWLSYCLCTTKPSVSVHTEDIPNIHISTSQRCLLMLTTHDQSTPGPSSNSTEVIMMGVVDLFDIFYLTLKVEEMVLNHAIGMVTEKMVSGTGW